MSKTKRDTQRGKIYKAEDAAFDKQQCEALSIEECQAFLDKCQRSSRLQARYPLARLPVTVADGRGRRRAGYVAGQISMPRWTRSRWQLLHELAHHLVRKKPAHGWRFAECYLYLVRVFLGRWAEEQLKRQFKAHRVKYTAPRRSTMTDEQRQAARDRMLAMHRRRQEAA